MLLPKLRRGSRQQLLLVVFTSVFEKDILVRLWNPLLDNNIVGIALPNMSVFSDLQADVKRWAEIKPTSSHSHGSS